MSEHRWTMPEWMEPYREFIKGTNGASVEDCMDRVLNARSSSVQVMRTLEVQVQVTLLYTLHREGKLS